MAGNDSASVPVGTLGSLRKPSGLEHLGPDISLRLAPFTEAEARTVVGWWYEPPYDFYNGNEAEIPVFLDPVNRYYAVHVGGDLVGYVCVGLDARVQGQEAEAGVDDIGWGFRPDLTGRGIASRWIPEALGRMTGELRQARQRVVIIDWNKRSQAAAERLGFQQTGMHHNDVGAWVVMTRANPAWD